MSPILRDALNESKQRADFFWRVVRPMTVKQLRKAGYTIIRRAGITYVYRQDNETAQWTRYQEIFWEDSLIDLKDTCLWTRPHFLPSLGEHQARDFWYTAIYCYCSSLAAGTCDFCSHTRSAIQYHQEVSKQILSLNETKEKAPAEMTEALGACLAGDNPLKATPMITEDPSPEQDRHRLDREFSRGFDQALLVVTNMLKAEFQPGNSNPIRMVLDRIEEIRRQGNNEKRQTQTQPF